VPTIINKYQTTLKFRNYVGLNSINKRKKHANDSWL
jgi:chromosome segregation and condensation protein ScpB